MNFIVIISDTLRRDFLGCYGNKWISTPNIDRFAQGSVVFDRAYCASFPTVPNRRDILTGCYTFTYTAWSPMKDYEVVLPEMLKDKNYTSMMVNDCPHILENGFHFDKGFDGFEWIRGQESDRHHTQPQKIELQCDRSKSRSGDHIVHHRRNISDRQYESDTFVARTMTAAGNWLEKNYKLDNFFLYVDAFDPHEPWDAPQWYVDMYDPGYIGQVVDYPKYDYTDFLTKEELKHCKALYAGEVSLVDRWVGQLLQKIADLGLEENTMVVFTADHGFLLGEHDIIGKALIGEDDFRYIPLYEEINHIPLIVKAPKCAPRRSNAIVQPPDITATIVDLAQAEDPGTMHGKSFANVLSGKTDKLRDFAASSPAIIGGGSGEAAPTITKGDWAAVISGKPIPIKGYADMAVDGVKKYYKGTTRPKATIDKVKSYKGDKRTREDLLYDVTSDPTQEIDRKSEYPEMLEEMRKDLISLLKETDTDEKLIEPWL